MAKDYIGLEGTVAAVALWGTEKKGKKIIKEDNLVKGLIQTFKATEEEAKVAIKDALEFGCIKREGNFIVAVPPKGWGWRY